MKKGCLGTVMDFIPEAERSNLTSVLGSVMMKDGWQGERLENCVGRANNNPTKQIEDNQRQGQWECKIPSPVPRLAFMDFALYSRHFQTQRQAQK